MIVKFIDDEGNHLEMWVNNNSNIIFNIGSHQINDEYNIIEIGLNEAEELNFMLNMLIEKAKKSQDSNE